MEHVTLKVNGMSCEHCVKAVTGAVEALPGAGGVKVDLAGGAVSLSFDSAQTSLEDIRAAIEESGYEVGP